MGIEDSGYLDRRPKKAEGLKIIDYIGIKYATFNGEKLWEIEKVIAKLIEECDGEKTFLDIAKKVSDKSGIGLDEIGMGLEKLFRELESAGFIEFV